MTCVTNDREPDEKNRVTTVVDRNPSSSSSLGKIACPSCGHSFSCQEKASSVHDLPGLPAGMKFDPSDTVLLQHLEGKVRLGGHKVLHPLIDEFIVTIEGDEGICYTHPEKLPGLSKDGQVRHFFHRPSKAYTTGTRKRRKVHTAEADGTETRWHKTGKTRPVLVDGQVKGHKKILVLYTNYGKQKKPEKTNWVMHQYHLGNDEDEKEGELVVSKVFYQTQPRQCGTTTKDASPMAKADSQARNDAASLLTLGSNFGELYDSSVISFEHHDRPMPRVLPNYTCP